MEECRIENLFNLEQTIAKDIFEGSQHIHGKFYQK